MIEMRLVADLVSLLNKMGIVNEHAVIYFEMRALDPMFDSIGLVS